MSFIVAVVLAVFAVVLGSAASDKIHHSPLSSLGLLPEFGSPADDFSDRITEWHVSDCGELTPCKRYSREPCCDEKDR